jgi:hypothetical protein
LLKCLIQKANYPQQKNTLGCEQVGVYHNEALDYFAQTAEVYETPKEEVFNIINGWAEEYFQTDNVLDWATYCEYEENYMPFTLKTLSYYTDSIGELDEARILTECLVRLSEDGYITEEILNVCSQIDYILLMNQQVAIEDIIAYYESIPLDDFNSDQIEFICEVFDLILNSLSYWETNLSDVNSPWYIEDNSKKPGWIRKVLKACADAAGFIVGGFGGGAVFGGDLVHVNNRNFEFNIISGVGVGAAVSASSFNDAPPLQGKN